MLTPKEINNVVTNLSWEDDARYSEYEAQVAALFNGCSDTHFTDVFLKKLWSVLYNAAFATAEDWQAKLIFCTNSIGAKALKYAPKNTNVFALNHDFSCHKAAKAIGQHLHTEWTPDIRWGCLADYYALGDAPSGSGYDIVINTYEEENFYYKEVDPNKSVTKLPYYLYCLVRSCDFVINNGYICSIIPNGKVKEMDSFNLKKYGFNYESQKIVTDATYTAYLFKIKK